MLPQKWSGGSGPHSSGTLGRVRKHWQWEKRGIVKPLKSVYMYYKTYVYKGLMGLTLCRACLAKRVALDNAQLQEVCAGTAGGWGGVDLCSSCKAS